MKLVDSKYILERSATGRTFLKYYDPAGYFLELILPNFWLMGYVARPNLAAASSDEVTHVVVALYAG